MSINKLKRWLCTAVFIASACIAQAQSLEQHFRQLVDSAYIAHPAATGIIVHLEAPDSHISWDYSVGEADKISHKKLLYTQPVLIASNTKTYVAAAVMRLVEQHKLRVDQPIKKLLSRKTAQLMSGAGYDLNRISLRQLMSHTSGVRDYVDDGYLDSVNLHRMHHWTREEQIALSVQRGGPYAQPADSFKYADLNYLLLTEVIETCTKKPFYEAMRSLLRFKEEGLDATWFTQLEQQPKGVLPLAHQYWSKYPWNSYDLEPSWDLYGGGGLVATTKDLALFFQKLFTGKIIQDTEVLATMYQDVPSKTKTNYCLGFRKVRMSGFTGYYHGGFWGTDAIYFPELNASIAITVLERSERELSADISKEIVSLIMAASINDKAH